MSKQPKSHLKRLTTFDYINSAILLLVAVCCVYPFLYVFFVATTDGTYLARGEMTFLPMGFNLKAFGYILTNPRFNVFAGMRNSFLYTALGTLLAVACTYVTAYVLSRPRFKHRYWLMSLFIITWVFDAGIIPQYIIYNQFGFVNSPWVMIVPGAISTQFLIITKTFLEGIPNELEEAAVVDGASDIKILTRVFLPLSPTVLATTGLFYAVSIWNQLFMPGKPQVWYLDLFAGKNDCEAVARAGEGGHKEINRTNLTKVQIAEALEKPVVKKQLELLRLRRNCPAFAQGAKIQIESCGPELTIEWSCSGHVARLQANLQKLTYRVEIE